MAKVLNWMQFTSRDMLNSCVYLAFWTAAWAGHQSYQSYCASKKLGTGYAASGPAVHDYLCPFAAFVQIVGTARAKVPAAFF